MQRTFLEDYEPGGTFSLPESLRADLHALGRTSPDESKEPSPSWCRAVIPPRPRWYWMPCNVCMRAMWPGIG